MRVLAITALGFLLISSGISPLHAHGKETHNEAQVEEREADLAEREAASQSASPEGEKLGAAPEEQAQSQSIGGMIANLHPATVHFPVALLLFAALAELLAGWGRSERLRATAEIAAVAGGISAAVAALFGWFHTGLWLEGGPSMQWHRWIGTGLGLAGPFIAWLALRGTGDRTFLRLALALASIAILAQGWLGGELAHGAGHLVR